MQSTQLTKWPGRYHYALDPICALKKVFSMNSYPIAVVSAGAARTYNDVRMFVR
jgi:hypothetical protein